MAIAWPSAHLSWMWVTTGSGGGRGPVGVETPPSLPRCPVW